MNERYMDKMDGEEEPNIMFFIIFNSNRVSFQFMVLDTVPKKQQLFLLWWCVLCYNLPMKMNKRYWPWPFNWFFLSVFFFYLFHLSIVCGLVNNSVIANNRIVFSQIIHTIFDKMNLYKKTVILQMFCQIQTKMFWHSVEQSAHKIKKNTDK